MSIRLNSGFKNRLKKAVFFYNQQITILGTSEIFHTGVI